MRITEGHIFQCLLDEFHFRRVNVLWKSTSVISPVPNIAPMVKCAILSQKALDCNILSPLVKPRRVDEVLCLKMRLRVQMSFHKVTERIIWIIGELALRIRLK